MRMPANRRFLDAIFPARVPESAPRSDFPRHFLLSVAWACASLRIHRQTVFGLWHSPLAKPSSVVVLGGIRATGARQNLYSTPDQLSA
jgi:hypothetical protein